ncbi:ribonuclease III [bacterium]|nr:ribonuclease III [bacterium]
MMRSNVMNLKEINPLVLAYLGDSIYETYIRLFLVKKNIPNIGSLQKESLSYVTAKKQALILNKLVKDNFFNEEELAIIRRARNTKGHRPPKGCDLATYHLATAFEAIIGYLYLKENKERIDNLMERIVIK